MLFILGNGRVNGGLRSNKIDNIGKNEGHQQHWQPPMFMHNWQRLEFADNVPISTGCQEAERVEVHILGEELDRTITDEDMGPAGMC